jgi:hypothetical protein
LYPFHTRLDRSWHAVPCCVVFVVVVCSVCAATCPWSWHPTSHIVRTCHAASFHAVLCCAVLCRHHFDLTLGLDTLAPITAIASSLTLSHLPCRAVLCCAMLCRRQFDLTLGLDTLTPITTIHERVKVWGEQSGKHIDLQVRDKLVGRSCRVEWCCLVNISVDWC